MEKPPQAYLEEAVQYSDQRIEEKKSSGRKSPKWLLSENDNKLQRAYDLKKIDFPSEYLEHITDPDERIKIINAIDKEHWDELNSIVDEHLERTYK